MNKFALILGHDQFDDEKFTRLITPRNNTHNLADLFSDPDIAGFDVRQLENGSKPDVERAVATLFQDEDEAGSFARRDDFLLLYLSGQGVRDEKGNLYFATGDTQLENLDETAISARWLKETIHNSHAERIVVILDCCFSGMFAAGATDGNPTGSDIALRGALLRNAPGRYVLTASSTITCAWEGGETLHGEGFRSEFAHHLMQGIAEGKADTNAQGEITINELYNYISENITDEQKPALLGRGSGEMVIAINQQAQQVPADLRRRAGTLKAATRQKAVHELFQIVIGEVNETIRTDARNLLLELSEDADEDVRYEANKFLYFSENTPRVFINYASNNRDLALEIKQRVQSWGFDVWIDREGIRGSDDWQARINNALLEMNAMVSVLTPESLDPTRGGDGRNWIFYEQRKAIDYNRLLFPLLFADLNALAEASSDPNARSFDMLPEHLRPWQYISFTEEAVIEERFDELQHLMWDQLWSRHLEEEQRCFKDDIKLERPFIGRSEEFERLQQWIDEHNMNGHYNAIAIHGQAGTGKSLFARAFLKEMNSRYRGGVFFEKFGRHTRDMQSILHKWAQEIGFGEDADKTNLTPEKLQSVFQERGCIPMLIVLDDIWEEDFKKKNAEPSNIEKLINAFPPYPQSIVLLTTQLRQDAEQQANCRIFSLGQLNSQDAVAFIRDRLEARLRDRGDDIPEEVARRMRAVPDEDLLELNNVLGGHPLAMELVIRNMGSGEIIDEAFVEKLRRKIRRGSQIESIVTHPDRDTSVALCFEETLTGLAKFDEGRTVEFTPLFRATGIFPDNTPLSTELFHAVWSIDEDDAHVVGEALAKFEDLALITPDPEVAGAYVMQPLISSFAQYILSDKQYRKEENRAFLKYTTYVIKQARAFFSRPASEWDDQNPLYEHIFHVGDLLWSKLRNVEGLGEFGEKPTEAELQQLAEPEFDADEQLDFFEPEKDDKRLFKLCVGFVSAVATYVRQRTIVMEVRNNDESNALKWLRMGLIGARLQEDDANAAQFCSDIGRLYRWGGELDRAIHYFDASLAILDEGDHSDDELYADNLLEKAGILSHQNEQNFAEAHKLVERARELNIESRKPEQRAKEFYVLGRNFWEKGEADEALVYYEQAFEIYPDGWMYNKMGSAYFSKSEYDRAIEYFRKGVEVAHDKGEIRWEAENYNDMGAAYAYKREPMKAREVLERAVELYDRAGHVAMEVIVYSNLGAASRQLGEFERAMTEFNDALSILERIGHSRIKREAGIYLNNLGMTYFDMRRYDDAMTTYDEAFALNVDNVRLQAGLLANRGRLWHEGYDDLEKAEADLAAAVEIMTTKNMKVAQGTIPRAEVEGWLQQVRDKMG